jgi:hypothetical protein
MQLSSSGATDVKPNSASHSFVDVVENALGVQVSERGIMRLSQQEIEAIGALLLDFYDAWTPPTGAPDLIRVFIEQSSVPWIDWHPGMPIPLPPLLSLLYVDSVFVEDPVSSAAAGMLRGPGRAHWTLVRRTLAAALSSFRHCRGLLLDGSLVLVPRAYIDANSGAQARGLAEALMAKGADYERLWQATTARAEEEGRFLARELFPDLLGGTHDRDYDLYWTDAGIAPQVSAYAQDDRDGKTSYPAPFGLSWLLTDRVLRSVCSATTVSASLLPSSLYTEATYQAILAAVASAAAPPDRDAGKVIPALLSGRLPSFVGVPPATIVQLRQSETAFDDWRAALRNAVRLIRNAPATPGFDLEARAVLDDALRPAMHELERNSSPLKRLRSGTKSAAVGFAVGAISAAAHGEPGLGSGLAAVGAGSAANLAFRALFPDGGAGSRAVVLRLMPYHRGKPPPQPALQGRGRTGV